MNHWSFQIIQEWDEVWSASHLKKWMDLLQQSNDTNVFIHPVLLRTWVDTYLPLRNIKPLIIWSTDETGNTVLMPLVLWCRNWKHAFTRCIVPIGYSDFDYHDPLSLYPINNTEKYWEQLFAFIKNTISYDSIEIDSIRDRNIGSTPHWNKNEICPYLTLDTIADEEQLLLSLSKNLRHNIRRRTRNIEQNGVLSFVVYNSWEEASMTFPIFLNEHTHKWPKAYKAPFFHQNLLKAGIKDGIVHFSSLNVGNKPIAWHLGFVYKRCFFLYMTAWDKDYAVYSPSTLHIYDLVKWAIAHNCTVFDFLRGDEAYKSEWSNGDQYVHSITLSNNKFSSKLKRTLLKLRP